MSKFALPALAPKNLLSDIEFRSRLTSGTRTLRVLASDNTFQQSSGGDSQQIKDVRALRSSAQRPKLGIKQQRKACGAGSEWKPTMGVFQSNHIFFAVQGPKSNLEV
jgi:hypothetical protein